MVFLFALDPVGTKFVLDNQLDELPSNSNAEFLSPPGDLS